MASTDTLGNIGTQVITLDMDGTLEDPWACCGKRDRMGGSSSCRHIRQDIIDRVANLQTAYPDAKLVILSWRGGCERVTREWLANVGIEVAAVFVPSSDDSLAIGARNTGQVGFKVNVVNALADHGVEVLTGFDDNADVVGALRGVGVPALLAPRIVKVERWEWVAGYLGAPRPAGGNPSLGAVNDLFNTDRGQLVAG